MTKEADFMSADMLVFKLKHEMFMEVFIGQTGSSPPAILKSEIGTAFLFKELNLTI